MILAAKIVLWFSLSAVLATYAVYPVSLMLLGALRRRRPPVAGNATPRVTLVVSAYNEAAVIRDKIENALALDYPRDRLEVMVISDGSDDGTDRIVASYADRGVVLKRQEPRAGKTSGLTRFVPRARGEVLVFSDANSMYQRDALRLLVRHFDDPAVGYVVGLQRYADTSSSAVGVSEGLYWRYETFIKVLESRFNSVVGGDGAIYAIRRELFRPLAADDINDFVNPLQIVARGYRGVFDSEAVCYEQTAGDFEGEFRRKMRIVNRSFRGVRRVPQVLNPWRVGWFAYQLTMHKLVRWCVPYFLLALLAANLLLVRAAPTWGYGALLSMQMIFYGVGLLHAVPRLRCFKPVYVAYYFCMVNVAAAMGILTSFGGARFVTWTPERAEADMAANAAFLPLNLHHGGTDARRQFQESA